MAQYPAMRRIWHSETVMLGLSAATLFCLLVLLGLYAYSGTILPSVENAVGIEALVIWLCWTGLIALPLATALLWAGRISER